MAEKIWEGILTLCLALFVTALALPEDSALKIPLIATSGAIGFMAIIGWFCSHHKKAAAFGVLKTSVSKFNGGLRVSIGYKNTGDAEAIDVIQSLMFWDQSLEGPPLMKTEGMANAIGAQCAHTINADIESVVNLPPAFVIFVIAFRSRRKQSLRERRFFYKWSGVKEGRCDDRLYEASVQERQLINLRFDQCFPNRKKRTT